jgi:HK97 family phage prohead protease
MPLGFSKTEPAFDTRSATFQPSLVEKRERRPIPMGELRAEKDVEGKTYLVGHAALYNSLSENLGTAARPWKECIMPGAFARALREKQDVMHLKNHDPNMILGRTKSGTLVLTEDGKGLRFRTLLPDTSYAKDLSEVIARGDLDECSFAFVSKKESWVNENGVDVRQIHDVDLKDVSVVAAGAYKQPHVSLEARMFPDGVPESIEQRLNAPPPEDPAAGLPVASVPPTPPATPTAAVELDETSGVCDCQCQACLMGSNCSNCDDPDCDDPECDDCPMQAEEDDPEWDNPHGTSLKAEILVLTAGERDVVFDWHERGLPKSRKIVAEAGKTKRVDGEDLVARDFIIATDVTDSSTWKLPWRFSTLEKTRSHLRNALSRFQSLKDVAEDVKKKAWSKLKGLCKKYGIKVTEDKTQNSNAANPCACDCANCKATDCSNCTMEGCTDQQCQNCPQQTKAALKSVVLCRQGQIVDAFLRKNAEDLARRSFRPEGLELRAKMHPDGTLELMCYGTVGQNWWGDGITAASVKRQIDEQPHSQIRMRINSMGGDAFEGIAIHNLLRAQAKPVETCVDGLAASAASIIAMAGDTISMGSNAMMMVHNAQTGVQGYASDMRKTADILDKISNAVCQTYADRTGNPMTKCQEMMDAETWMTAADCIKDNFATTLTEMPDQPEPDEDELRSSPLALTYRNLPERYKAPAPAPASAEQEADDSELDELDLRLRLASIDF